MKLTASLSLFFGLAALTQAQTLKPSPTESVGCVSHGDHWDCDGPRVTATGSLPTPTSAHPEHDDDHDDHDDEDRAFDHDDVDKHHNTTPLVSGASTPTLKPSPTESFGCEAHGDHWHCEGSVTALTTMTGSGFTSVITPAPTTAAGTAAAADATSTAGAGRSHVAGLAVAAAAVAFAI